MSVVRKKTRNASKKSGNSVPSTESEITYDFGVFNFPNGDVYKGGFKICLDKKILLRYGNGIYYTHDFNLVDTEWIDDKIGETVSIKYNNGAEFRYSINVNNEANNEGTYTFPDGSVIIASWHQNEPIENIQYKTDSFGRQWKGQFIDNNSEIIFTEGNHFWDDLKCYD